MSSGHSLFRTHSMVVAAALAVAGCGSVAEPAAEPAAVPATVPAAALAAAPEQPIARQPAPTVDPAVADAQHPVWREYWLPIENVSRDRSDTTRVVDAYLDVRPGMSVADLGAGGGYFSFRLARAVGPSGSVLATDIEWRMTAKIAWEAQARGVTNLTVMRSNKSDLALGDARLDVLLINDAPVLNQCTVQGRVNAVAQIARAVRPGGRFVYFSETPESTPDTSCEVPSEEEFIALTARYFEVTASQHFAHPGGNRTWRGFALQLRRNDSPAP